MSTNPPVRRRDAQGREVPSNRVRRTIRRAIDRGRDRIGEIAGSVSAHLAGRATRPLALIPVPVRVDDVPQRPVARSGGCFSVWVASPSATR